LGYWTSPERLHLVRVNPVPWEWGWSWRCLQKSRLCIGILAPNICWAYLSRPSEISPTKKTKPTNWRRKEWGWRIKTQILILKNLGSMRSI
jgi:hypothetical protein